jgi:hypothetical protein
MKMYGEVNVRLHSLLISVLDGDEWSISQAGFSTRDETPLLTWQETERHAEPFWRGDHVKDVCLRRKSVIHYLIVQFEA